MADEALNQAKEIIEADKKQRADQCRAELDQVLNKYRCILVMQPQAVDPVTIRVVPAIRALV